MTTDGRALLLDRMTEAEFQKQVMEWARRGDWLIHHTHDSRFQEWGTDAGFPDLVLARGARVIFAELKREGGRPTKFQRQWLNVLTGGDVEVYVWRPRDEKAIREVLGA